MRNLAIVSTLAFVAAVAAAPAYADEPTGWYVGAGAGATFPVDPSIQNGLGSSVGGKDESANVDAMVQGGYALEDGLRLEGEYFHNQNNTTGVTNDTGAGGHITNNAIFANVYYDFRNSSMFTPYIGAGFGGDFVNVKSVGANNVGYLVGDTFNMAYQGIVGVAAQLNSNFAVTADYRYVASFDPKVDSTLGGQGRVSNASHNVMIGVRYNFDTPEPPPVVHTTVAPVVTPRVASKPVVVPVDQSFTVFFDFRKATLTPEAEKILASAAEEFKHDGYVKITVTGHTDTVGTEAFNQKLSEERAKAVEVELAKLGVDKQSIKIFGVGKHDLMVPTADGVREAQNRRAEIVMDK